MAPLRDAVSLVDGDQGGFAFRKHLGKAGNAHPFGGDEQELEGSVEIVATGLARFVAGEAGVDASDAEAEGGELGCLVVHQRNEWRDDECCASPGKRGELIAERLSRTGGHDEQNVAAIGCGAADGFLVGTEAGEAEGPVEEV